jgi:hypothetical protein
LIAVSFEREINCHDFARRFDGFLDGEMDAHSLRSMAIHASHCESCGADLEHAESLQELLARAVEAEADRIDASGLWRGIQSRLEPAHAPLLRRLRDQMTDSRWAPAVPALAVGGALAALLALLFWPGAAPSDPTRVADNHAQIDRIESSAPHVAVWSEPAEHTTAIWVASYEPEGGP